MKQLMKTDQGKYLIWCISTGAIAVIMRSIQEYEGMIFFAIITVTIAIMLPFLKSDSK